MVRFTRVRELIRQLFHRSIRPTSEGVRFLLLTLGVGAAAVNTGHNLLYLFFAMMLSLILISGILSEQCFRRLEIHRQLPVHLFANRPATTSLIITNRKASLSTFSLRVMDVVAGSTVDRGIHLLHLAPGTTIRQSYPLLVSRRGRYRFDGVKLSTRFPFGLFVKATILPLHSEVLVYPYIRSLPAAVLQALAARGQGESIPQRGQGAGLYNLRLYQPGDDSRTIHWKTTARKTQLIVRETEAEHLQRVTLALHTGLPHDPHRHSDDSSERAFEDAVGLTASLVNFFQRRGYQVRLLIGEDKGSYGIGAAHFYRLLTRLALCEPTERPSSKAMQSLGALSEESEQSVVILPVADALTLDLCRDAGHIFIASELTWPA